MRPYKRIFKEESGLDNYLNEYPDDAKSWADATDELRDIAKTAREFISEYDNETIKPLDFKSFKTPSEWNTKAKKYIKDTYESMSDNCKKEFENELKDRFRIEFSESRIETEKVEWYDWAASYFINNDHSGLSDEDLELADQFLDEMKADGYSWCIDADFDSKRFGKPMGYRLAGDLIEYTFQKTN